jgi:hypothetical protein
MEKNRIPKMAVILSLLLFLVGCAGVPVRDEVKVNMKVPVGKIEGNQFTGLRYPFNVTAPPGWQVSTQYPEFMLKLGFEKEGLEESEVFVFNPATQSNIQIDFAPAGRYSRFDQEKIQWITHAAGGSFEEEFRKDYGKNASFEISNTEPYPLKGVPFAAKRYTTYSVKGVKREHGWIYAFAEPYQIFIIYVVMDKGEPKDRQDMKAILDSFEVTGPK